jgi:glycine/D-amino acid oxidase-like deaminating enzyme
MRIGILGQGLAGTALAWQAHWAGHSVHIFDPGSQDGASWVAAGLINPIVLKRKRLVQDAHHHMATMDRFYTRVTSELKTSLFYPGPVYEVLPDWASLRAWEDLALDTAFAPFIGPCHPLPHAALQGEAMGEVLQSRRLRVPHYLAASRSFFAREHHVHSELVTTLTLGDGRVQLQGQALDVCLLAEGYPGKWTESFFGPLPFAPTRGEGLHIAWEGEPITHALHKNIFLLPDGDGRYQAGSTYAWDQLDAGASEAAREEILTKLQGWFTQAVRVENQWVGVRPTMQDRQPRWGWHPAHPHLGYLNGLGSRGALTAPALSQRLLEALETASGS